MGYPDPDASIEAWRHSLAAIVDLCADLSPSRWDTPSECPLWTVKDVCSHLVGGEEWMCAGHPRPEHGLATIAGDAVAARRDRAGADVHEELCAVFARRQRQLADEPPDPDEPTFTAYGVPVALGTLLSHRAFDLWVHEQDIRRALGVPGNLGTAGARLSAEILLASLPRVVAKLAAAPPESVVRLTVDGEVAFDRAVTLDAAGRGHLAPWTGAGTGDDPTAHLRMDWETYSRLAAGRIAADKAEVTVDGDMALADRILARFAVTP